MRNRLFILGTGLFWLAIFAIWATSRMGGGARQAEPPAPPVLLTLAEVARHATAEDCWMAINGRVYDVTIYLPKHPTKPRVILSWCGREASEAYRTKNRGRPHSPEADRLLAEYEIGVLAPEGGFGRAASQ